VTVSRLHFLKLFGAALAAPTLDPSLLAAAFAGDATGAGTEAAGVAFPLETASAARFRELLHTPFQARTVEGGVATLVLARVIEGPRDGAVEQFSLEFRATHGSVPLTGTCSLRHAGVGAFDLFIARIGNPRAGDHVYEACFSRFVEPASARHTRRLPTHGGTRWPTTS
jgi:hypothetical protein